MSDRCAFVYDRFLVLPAVIHAIVDPYGDLWHFVLKCWGAAIEETDTVSQFWQKFWCQMLPRQKHKLSRLPTCLTWWHVRLGRKRIEIRFGGA